MAAPQDNKSLEKSTEGLEQDSQNPSSSVSLDVPLDTTTSSEGDDFIESSPAVLEPSQGEFIRQVWGRRLPLSKRFVGLTPPTTSTVSVAALRIDSNAPEPQVEQPTNAQVGAQLQQDGAVTIDDDAQRLVDDSEQQMDPRIELLSNNCCTALYVFYMDAVLGFRNSSLIYLVQILMSGIPLSGIVFGLSFLSKCPGAFYLPALCAGLGMAGLLFIGLWIASSSINRRGEECPTSSKIALIVFGVLLVLVSIADGVLVYLLAPSTDPESRDYCDDTFYTYSYYKEMATAAAVGVAVLIYMPEICRVFCCAACLLRHSRPYYVL